MGIIKLIFYNYWLDLKYRLLKRLTSTLYSIIDSVYDILYAFIIYLASKYLYFEIFWFGLSIILIIISIITLIILTFSYIINSGNDYIILKPLSEFKEFQKNKLFRSIPHKIVMMLLMVFSWNKTFNLVDLHLNYTLEIKLVIILFIYLSSLLIIDIIKLVQNKIKQKTEV